MIRAVYRNGSIQPVDKVPGSWLHGEELTVEQTGGKMSPEEIHEFDAWVADVEAATAKISPEDHDRFMAVLNQLEAESKELGCRELERYE